MRKIKTWVALLLAMVMLFSCGVLTASADDTLTLIIKAEFKYDEARSMLKQINELRKGKDAWYWSEDDKTKVQCAGLKDLEYDYELEATAMKRAMELAAHFSHTRPNGSSCFTAFPNSTGTKGENVAYGFGSAKTAFDAFAEADKSYAGQGHRRNMLRKEFTKVGIGAVKVGNVVYWAQAFGSGAANKSDKYRLKENQIKASSQVISSSIRNSGTDSDEIELAFKESAKLPNVVISSSSGARLTVQGLTWKSENDKVAKVKKNKVTAGKKKGKTNLVTTVAGMTIKVSVNVVKKKADSAKGETLDIEDYDTPLAADIVFAMENDECFEKPMSIILYPFQFWLK